MIASALIRKIRAHKGKLLAPINSPNDVMHIAVEKQDLIKSLKRFSDEECGYTLYELDDGAVCFGPDHSADY